MASYKWESLKSMPTKRVFSTAVPIAGKLYVLGGCDAKGIPLDSFESYDADTRQWKALSAMPTKRAATCAVSVGNKLVALGGVSISQQPLDAVEVYDTDTKKWQKAAALKDKLLGIAAVERDGQVITVGGMSVDTNPKDYLMSYDLKEDRWQALPPMPTPRYATFAFLINDKLYVLGGRQGKIPVDAFEMYDFSVKTWKTLPSIPSKRVFALYAHSETDIFSLGGLKEKADEGFSDVTEVFNLETETWKICKPMCAKRGDFAVGYIGGKVVVAGGLGNQGRPMTEAEVYDISADKWTSIGDIPTGRCSCAYVTFHQRLYVIGGLCATGHTGVMEALMCKT